MVRIPFLLCLAPLIIGVLGFGLLRKKWGSPQAIWGGLLLGGLGMWLGELTLYILDYGSSRLTKLADSILPLVASTSMLQAAAIGAWTTLGYALSHGVGILIIFVALFGLVIGKSGRLIAMQHSDPMSDKTMSVSTPLRGWGIGLAAVGFALIIAPIFGGALGVLLAMQVAPESALERLLAWFPLCTGFLAAMLGVALAVWSCKHNALHDRI